MRIDPKTNKVAEAMAVGRKANGVATGGGFVWVTNAADGTVWRIDPKTKKVLTVSARGTPTGVAVGPSALVANGPEHSLAAIDPTTGSVASLRGSQGSPGLSLPVAAGPEGVWFADPAERIVGNVEKAFKGGSVSEQVRDSAQPDQSRFQLRSVRRPRCR